MWLGATPEHLLKINGQHFSTMALAGTQSFKGNLEVEWQKKELEELIAIENWKFLEYVQECKMTAKEARDIWNKRYPYKEIKGLL